MGTTLSTALARAVSFTVQLTADHGIQPVRWDLTGSSTIPRTIEGCTDPIHPIPRHTGMASVCIHSDTKRMGYHARGFTGAYIA